MGAVVYWFTCWTSWLNCIRNPKNLTNVCTFVTLPALLSFSTDISVESPSWFEPHHQPLKVPCWERLCFCLTHALLCDRSHFPWRRLRERTPRTSISESDSHQHRSRRSGS